MAALVTSVESFSITISGTSNTATLTKGQTIANCVPFITKRVATACTKWDEYAVDAYFSGSTVVAARIGSASGSIQVEGCVVEFDPAEADVQQGTFDTTADGDSQSITSVTVADAFLYFSYGSAFSSNRSYRAYCDGYLVGSPSSTQVDFDVQQGGGPEGHFYVVEAQNSNFSVEHFSMSFGFDDGSKAATIGSVNTGKSMTLGAYAAGDTFLDRDNDDVPSLELTNATTVTATRNGSTGTGSLGLHGNVIDFAGNESVQRGTLTQVAATASENVTISTVTEAETMAIAPASASAHSGAFTGYGDTLNMDALASMQITGPTTLNVQHYTGGGSDDNKITWEVVQWDLTGAAPRRIMAVS